MPQSGEVYSLYLTESADRDLDAVPAFEARFMRAIETLASNPARGHPLTGTLARARSLVLTRDSGGYRAVYLVFPDQHALVVFAIGPHATVYDTALKRFPPPAPMD